MTLAVKLEAALVKYLQTISPSPFPDYFDKATQIKPGENDEDIDAQYLRCRAAENAESEFPQFSGNFWWPVEIELLSPSGEQTEAEEASDDPVESIAQLAKHRALAVILEAAVMVDNLPALLNAAALALGEGYELTVFGVRDRVPANSQLDDHYSSGWTLRLYCCSSTLA